MRSNTAVLALTLLASGAAEAFSLGVHPFYEMTTAHRSGRTWDLYEGPGLNVSLSHDFAQNWEVELMYGFSKLSANYSDLVPNETQSQVGGLIVRRVFGTERRIRFGAGPTYTNDGLGKGFGVGLDGEIRILTIGSFSVPIRGGFGYRVTNPRIRRVWAAAGIALGF